MINKLILYIYIILVLIFFSLECLGAMTGHEVFVNDRWIIFNKFVHKSAIVYICQIFIIYTIITCSLVNLSLGSGNEQLWIALLCTSTGSLLPQPRLRSKHLVTTGFDELDSKFKKNNKNESKTYIFKV